MVSLWIPWSSLRRSSTLRGRPPARRGRRCEQLALVVRDHGTVLARHLRGQLHRPAHHVRLGRGVLHDAQRQRLLRAVPTAGDQGVGRSGGGQPGRDHGEHPRGDRQAQVHLRQAPVPPVPAHHPLVERAGQHGPTREGVAVEGRHGEGREQQHPAEQAVHALQDGSGPVGIGCERVQVQSIGEELALAGQHHRHRPVPGLQVVQHLVPAGDAVAVEPVLAVGPSEQDHIAVLFQVDHGHQYNTGQYNTGQYNTGPHRPPGDGRPPVASGHARRTGLIRPQRRRLPRGAGGGEPPAHRGQPRRPQRRGAGPWRRGARRGPVPPAYRGPGRPAPAGQGHGPLPGLPHHHGVAAACRRAARRRRRRGGGAAAGGRGHRGGADQQPRLRPRPLHHQPAARSDPQPVEPGAFAGRVQRWLRRGAGRGARPARHHLRRWGQRAHPGRALRPGGAQADHGGDRTQRAAPVDRVLHPGGHRTHRGRRADRGPDHVRPRRG